MKSERERKREHWHTESEFTKKRKERKSSSSQSKNSQPIRWNVDRKYIIVGDYSKFFLLESIRFNYIIINWSHLLSSCTAQFGKPKNNNLMLLASVAVVVMHVSCHAEHFCFLSTVKRCYIVINILVSPIRSQQLPAFMITKPAFVCLLPVHLALSVDECN